MVMNCLIDSKKFCLAAKPFGIGVGLVLIPISRYYPKNKWLDTAD